MDSMGILADFMLQAISTIFSETKVTKIYCIVQGIYIATGKILLKTRKLNIATSRRDGKILLKSKIFETVNT